MSNKKYIEHPDLQIGFGFFICEVKNCKQQIIPMCDMSINTIVVPIPDKPHRNKILKIQVVRCRKCAKDYSKPELDRLAKEKKLFRAVKK